MCSTATTPAVDHSVKADAQFHFIFSQFRTDFFSDVDTCKPFILNKTIPSHVVYRDRGGLFSPDGGEESPWATPSTPATPSSPPTPTEAEGDGLSYNQRSLQRWEKDEELGELSTISPVLYANTNFPTLKQDYPGECGRNALTCTTYY